MVGFVRQRTIVLDDKAQSGLTLLIWSREEIL